MVFRWLITAYVGLFVWGLVFIFTVFVSYEIMHKTGLGSFTGDSFHLTKQGEQMASSIFLADAVVSGVLVWLAGALYFGAKKKAALRKARTKAECEIDGVGFN